MSSAREANQERAEQTCREPGGADQRRAGRLGERVRARACQDGDEAQRGEDRATEDVLERRSGEPDTEQRQRQVQPARVEERVREERERVGLGGDPAVAAERMVRSRAIRPSRAAPRRSGGRALSAGSAHVPGSTFALPASACACATSAPTFSPSRPACASARSCGSSAR